MTASGSDVGKEASPLACRGVATLVCAVALCGFAAGASGGDFERGRLLYDNHCRQCHESRAHLRERRKAFSRAALGYQVDRWQRVLGLGWGREEIADVVEYLNQRYYHYPHHAPPWTALEPPAADEPAHGPS